MLGKIYIAPLGVFHRWEPRAVSKVNGNARCAVDQSIGSNVPICLPSYRSRGPDCKEVN